MISTDMKQAISEHTAKVEARAAELVRKGRPLWIAIREAVLDVAREGECPRDKK